MIDQMSAFYAQHTRLVKTLGGAALTIALAKMANAHRGWCPRGLGVSLKEPGYLGNSNRVMPRRTMVAKLRASRAIVLG
jgi:hypothetical protein